MRNKYRGSHQIPPNIIKYHPNIVKYHVNIVKYHHCLSPDRRVNDRLATGRCPLFVRVGASPSAGNGPARSPSRARVLRRAFSRFPSSPDQQRWRQPPQLPARPRMSPAPLQSPRTTPDDEGRIVRPPSGGSALALVLAAPAAVVVGRRIAAERAKDVKQARALQPLSARCARTRRDDLENASYR